MSSLLFYSVLGFGTLTLAKSCASSNFTINSATKASPLADCSTFIGDVVITRSADPQIDLSGPTQIEGDVIMENNGGVIVLSSSSLTTITGLLALENVTLLSTLNMPALTSVGSIHWVSLPALNSLSFTSGITKAGNISVVNTFLSSLEGIEPSSIGELRIVSNRRLRKIDLPIRNITGNLTFQHNGVKAQIVSSNPVVAKALNINNVTSFEASRREAIGGHAQLNSDYFALPLLTTIGGLASFDDSQFNNLKAPSLENCGGLIITNNPTLTDIDLPALKTISGQLKMTNNTMLETVDGLKGLTTVLTDIKVRGLLSSVELPSLNNVGGDFEVSSTNDISDSCDVLKQLAPVSQCGDGRVNGTFACLSNNEDSDKDYCTNNSHSGTAGVRTETGMGTFGLSLALVSLLLL